KPSKRAARLCRGIGGAGIIRHSRRHPAASLLSNHQGSAGRVADRMDQGLHRGADPHCGDRRQCGGQPTLSGAVGEVAGHRHGGLGCNLAGAAAATTRLGGVAATFQGTVFLLSLVTAALRMPVEKLPAASWQTAFGLGLVSAAFDNIPLTALALRQGGYDWGFLAFAVGFGGSMIWFGSSAGVALANMFPEAKS